MELVVRKNDLLRELQLFQGIVERKNTIPILANVLIEAKGDEMRMLATDLEVALRSKCAASVAKAGSLTLPAKKLYEIARAGEGSIRDAQSAFDQVISFSEGEIAIGDVEAALGLASRELLARVMLREVGVKLMPLSAGVSTGSTV